jgi:hypothetical protein
LLNVATVVVPAVSVSLSYWVVVVVSAVSMCRKNVSVALQPGFSVTAWAIDSV